MSQKAACLVFVIGLTCLLFAQASGSEGKLNNYCQLPHSNIESNIFFELQLHYSLANMNMFYANFTKGQLISKANSKLFNWTKKPTKIWSNQENIRFINTYLINVGPTLTDFEKFHPPQKKSTLHVYWFLRFFPPSTPRLLELCISFFHKIPPSMFFPTSKFR